MRVLSDRPGPQGSRSSINPEVNDSRQHHQMKFVIAISSISSISQEIPMRQFLSMEKPRSLMSMTLGG
jgi:hypothetical protein